MLFGHSTTPPSPESHSSQEHRRDMHLVRGLHPVPQRSSNCMEVTLRPYDSGDLQGMTALDRMCFPKEFLFGQTMMQVLAEAAHALTIIADVPSGEMAGFAIAHRRQEENPDAAYLVTIDVRSDLRRCGIGGGLLRRVERVLLDAGVACLELHVYTGNPGAIRFYEAQGYKRKARVPHFYGVGDRDAFLYAKTLAKPVAVARRPGS